MEALGALREQLLLIQSMQHEGVLSAEARCCAHTPAQAHRDFMPFNNFGTK